MLENWHTVTHADKPILTQIFFQKAVFEILFVNKEQQSVKTEPK